MSRALLLAGGTVIWEASIHSAVLGHAEAGALGHVARDTLLAWPLAMLATVAGSRWADRLAGRHIRVVRGICIAMLFSLMLIPAIVIHGTIDTLLDTGQMHVAALAPDSLPGSLRHGARDAAIALIAALPIALLVARPGKRRGRGRVKLSPALAAAALAAAQLTANAPSLAAHTPFSVSMPVPRVISDPNITIAMQEACLQILPGPCTKMWTYDGTFPGPTIRRPSGQPTKVTFVNQLPAAAGEMTVHHHGNHSASSEDGQPDDHLIPHGGSRTYTYELMERGEPERAATQWYHDHRMDVTGRNVWMGLAGMFIVDDAFDAALPLPKEEFDVPIVLADRNFDQSNQLVYEFDTRGTRGDHALVNGALQPYFEVADRKYRFRILNASNRRDYRLELDTGQDMIQIAAESGLLPTPVRRSSIVLGAAQRAEVVIDFAGQLGRDVVLKETLGIEPQVNPALLQFRVRHHAPDESSVPTVLRAPPQIGEPSFTRIWTLDGISFAGKVRRPEAVGGFRELWLIGGKPFDPERVDARPARGATERWVFVNTSSAQHLVHIHDVDWRIVSRSGGVEVFTEGDPDAALSETGLRETFLVQSGEVVEVVSKFSDHLGRYVLHCHVLEHEDNAMMAQFEVVDR